jgi:UDP-N-acetylmuramate-alanine ligase
VLSTEKIADDLRRQGKDAMSLPTVDAILEYLLSKLQPGDTVITFSNGPFGGIHDRLLTDLQKK